LCAGAAPPGARRRAQPAGGRAVSAARRCALRGGLERCRRAVRPGREPDGPGRGNRRAGRYGVDRSGARPAGRGAGCRRAGPGRVLSQTSGRARAAVSPARRAALVRRPGRGDCRAHAHPPDAGGAAVRPRAGRRGRRRGGGPRGGRHRAPSADGATGALADAACDFGPVDSGLRRGRVRPGGRLAAAGGRLSGAGRSAGGRWQSGRCRPDRGAAAAVAGGDRRAGIAAGGGRHRARAAVAPQRAAGPAWRWPSAAGC
jgi:hypothetical protein